MFRTPFIVPIFAYLPQGRINNMEKPISQITFDFEDTASITAAAITSPAAQLLKKEGNKIEEKIIPITETVKTIVPGKRGRKSLKTVDENADLVQIPEDEILFQKQYYSIGDVAEMFRENTSLIRYWETEFDILNPRKNRKGDRFFRPIDVKNLKLIYDLLRRRKMTIEGAKAYLKNSSKADEKYELIQSLEKIKGFLLEMKASL
jgi:DNA-binding transcriptional MerR regulator